MRDPLSRKLFQSRDAREKLRGMGGIMASSPQLAQTVAKFQEGGSVRTPTYSEWLQMSRAERRRAGLPESFIGGQMYFNRFGVGMGMNDPETGVRIPPALSAEEAAMGEFGGLPPYMVEPGGTVDEPAPGAGLFPPTPGEMAFDLGEAVGFGPALAQAGVERPVPRVVEAEEQVVDPTPPSMTEEVPEEERVPAPETEKTPAPATTPAASITETGAAIASGDFDTTYEQMLARLQGVMGTEDKDSREKAMANLAMIGLAIAAGQSPNALTNIAQGALVGMQGIQQAEAAETAREREMRLEAMRLAASEVELSRRLQSAEDIAALRAGSGTGTYTLERLYQQNMGAILQNPDMFDVLTDNVVDPTKVTALAQSLSERGMSLGTTGGDQQYTPGQLVVQDGVTYEYQQDGTWQPAGE
jgi:hypothetical protein